MLRDIYLPWSNACLDYMVCSVGDTAVWCCSQNTCAGSRNMEDYFSSKCRQALLYFNTPVYSTMSRKPGDKEITRNSCTLTGRNTRGNLKLLMFFKPVKPFYSQNRLQMALWSWEVFDLIKAIYHMLQFWSYDGDLVQNFLYIKIFISFIFLFMDLTAFVRNSCGKSIVSSLVSDPWCQKITVDFQVVMKKRVRVVEREETTLPTVGPMASWLVWQIMCPEGPEQWLSPCSHYW